MEFVAVEGQGHSLAARHDALHTFDFEQLQLLPNGPLELIQCPLRRLLCRHVGGDPELVAIALAEFAEAERVLALGVDDEAEHLVSPCVDNP